MEEYKNLEEIIELCEEELNNNDENVTAILDLTDLKDLRNLINKYKEEKNLRIHYENRLDNMEQLYIDKDKVKEIIKELKTEKNKHTDYYFNIQEVIRILSRLLESGD